MSERWNDVLDNLPPEVDLRAASVGDDVAVAGHRLRREDLVAYAQASGDENPIHQDEDFARSVGLPDVIAHGMLTMGLVASLVEFVAQEHEVTAFSTRFAAPVVVPSGSEGADVEIALRVLSRDDSEGTVTLDATCVVAGTKVLSRTRATVRLD